MPHPSLDYAHLATKPGADSARPARRWRREDPIGGPRHAEGRDTHRRQAAKVVESIRPEPRAAHVPLHPFGDDLRRLVFVAQVQRPRREATQRPREGNRGGGERAPYGSEPARARCPERDDRGKRSRRRNARQPAQTGGGSACRGRHARDRSEEHTSELQSPCNLVCRLLLEKKKTNK